MQQQQPKAKRGGEDTASEGGRGVGRYARHDIGMVLRGNKKEGTRTRCRDTDARRLRAGVGAYLESTKGTLSHPVMVDGLFI
jgi:hypothetical protein